MLPVWSAASPAARLSPLRVTPDGRLAGSQGSLLLLLGELPRPLAARAATWLGRGAPPLAWGGLVDDVSVQAQAVGQPLEALPGEVGLLRLVARARVASRLVVRLAWVADGGWGAAWPLAQPTARYTFHDGWLSRDGALCYTFPLLPGRTTAPTLDEPTRPEFSAAEVQALRASPLGVVRYELDLAPEKPQALVFRMPTQALSAALAVPLLRRLDFDETVLRQRAQEDAWRATAAALQVAEPKVAETWAALTLRHRDWRPPALPSAASLAQRPLERGLVLLPAAAGPAWLSPWQTAQRGRLELAAGRPAAALAALYAVLLHSTASGQLADAVPAAWGLREAGYRWGVPDDSRPAAAWLALLGECLVAARDGRLDLGTALSPAWLQPGAVIRLERWPTAAGPLGYEVVATAAGCRVRLLQRPSGALRWRLPWCWPAASASAAGQPLRATAGWVDWPASENELVVAAGSAERLGEPSYAGWLAAFRAQYAERAAAWQADGGVWEAAPGVEDAATRRVRYEEHNGRVGDE
ncbi:MAG: hypothetical protein IT204_14415 [Fimbriimonadaceae bacterium]|nr:hypothetical protein [Fimbriimonadaceae bacterium]